MEQNRWPAIRSEATMYLFDSSSYCDEDDELRNLKLQLREKEAAKARLLRETEANNAEIEIVENEIRSIEEAIDRQKSVCERQNMEWKASGAELDRILESYSTPRWIRVRRTEELTAIERMKRKFPNKTLRFCLGRKARSVDSIQRIAGWMGIGVMDPRVLHELSDGKFRVLSEAESRLLQFTF